MEIFRKLFGNTMCPMCEGKGSLPKPEPGLEIRFGEKPENLNERELALVIANAGKHEELSKKLGLDPEQIKISFEFKDTGHHMCFMVAREKKGS